MVLVPYAGKYFGRKCAYWGEWGAFFYLCSVLLMWMGGRGDDVERREGGRVEGGGGGG